jgi:hypothetical protein
VKNGNKISLRFDTQPNSVYVSRLRRFFPAAKRATALKKKQDPPMFQGWLSKAIDLHDERL